MNDSGLRSFLNRVSRNIATGGGGHRISEFGQEEIDAQMRDDEMREAKKARGDAEWAEGIRKEVRARGLDRIVG